MLLNKADAEARLEGARFIAEEIGDRVTTMEAIGHQAPVVRLRPDLPGAIELSLQALAIARETGDRNGEAQYLNDLANLRNNTGDPAAARQLYLEALARVTESGNRRLISMTSGNLGILDLYGGRLTEARRLFEESDKLLRSIHEESMQPVIQLARLAIIEGRPQDAEAPLNALPRNTPSPRPHVRSGGYWRRAGWRARASALAAQTPNRVDYGIPAGPIAARVKAASGEFDNGRREMTALLEECRKLGHVPNGLNVRYAIADVERRAGHMRVAEDVVRSLRKDAGQMGFGQIASAAERITKPAISADL
jgi:tetratricopeptide (TPR) repeat protein